MQLFVCLAFSNHAVSFGLLEACNQRFTQYTDVSHHLFVLHALPIAYLFLPGCCRTRIKHFRALAHASSLEQPRKRSRAVPPASSLQSAASARELQQSSPRDQHARKNLYRPMHRRNRLCPDRSRLVSVTARLANTSVLSAFPCFLDTRGASAVPWYHP